VLGTTSDREYDPGQLAAGRRSMTRLAGLIGRGGRPAAVAPTVSLRPAEQQYGWFPVDTAAGRVLTVVTNQRLIVGPAEHRLADVTSIEPDPAAWSVTLRFRLSEPVTLRGPWVPWLAVVLCAEIHGAAFPPGYARLPEIRIPMQRIQLPALRRN
jgi:hypothetical protein